MMDLTNIKKLICDFYDGIGNRINNMSESEISDLCASATTIKLDPEISELYKNSIGIDFNNLSEPVKNSLLNVKSDEFKDVFKNFSSLSSVYFDDHELKEAMEKIGTMDKGEDILRQFVEIANDDKKLKEAMEKIGTINKGEIAKQSTLIEKIQANKEGTTMEER